MGKYIGITFGPITRLTESVKSTKALWASSYFFSYLAREIIRPFRSRPFEYPLVGRDELWENSKGIGCFPDRYIFRSEPGDTQKLADRIGKVLRSTAEQIADSLQAPVSDIHTFIEHYLKVYFFEKEPDPVPDDSGRPGVVNIPGEFNPIFDLLEMQDTYNLEEKDNYLLRFFESPNLYRSFLATDAGLQAGYFQSLDTISRAEKKLSPSLPRRACHNYIAIITADGDHMTRTINQLLTQGKKVTKLSECIFNFGRAIAGSSEFSARYGARIIFLGGDDLLIFAPVKYGENTVFDLIKELDEIFNREMSALCKPPSSPQPCATDEKCNCETSDLPALPTLSAGVSISFCKFPMGESLKLAHQFLSEAKEEHGRNALVCQLQKHSGQRSKIYFKKGTESYAKGLELIRTYTGEDAQSISSLTHWIGLNRQLLSRILNTPENREKRLEQYFGNSLNEAIHQLHASFIACIREYMLILYKETGKADVTLDSTGSLLRIIHFINTERDE